MRLVGRAGRKPRTEETPTEISLLSHVGSVGTFCAVGLFLAADDDPIFLQVKEANASVLEAYAGKSLHQNHGQRVVVDRRVMQSATDIFLGWSRGLNRRDVYVRQLRDMKIRGTGQGAC